jgi:hypothetical protein
MSRKRATSSADAAASESTGEAARLPSVSLLLRAWGLLMALTIGTMIAGRVTSAASLGLLWTAILMVITWAKARTILMVYLNLRAAPAHWRSGFSGSLIFLLLLILGIYALDATGLIPGRQG